MHKITDATDVMLRAACEGKEGRGVRLKCLTVLPQLFEHHRPRGSKAEWSEIREYAGFNERPFTLNVRWSTRVNLGELVSGETDYLDLWPDGELPPLGLLGRNKWSCPGMIRCPELGQWRISTHRMFLRRMQMEGEIQDTLIGIKHTHPSI
jgi:hypothetical protein